MSDLAEPGLWLLVAIVVLGVSRTLGAAWARPHYRKLNAIANEVLASPDANDGDRSWLRDVLRDATNRWPIRATALVAPIFGVYAAYDAVRTVISERSAKDLQAEIDGLVRETSQQLGGIDPQSGAFWGSPKRHEAIDAAFTALLLSSPIMLVWIGVWLLPAFGVLLFGGVAAVVRKSALQVTLERVTSFSMLRVGAKASHAR